MIIYIGKYNFDINNLKMFFIMFIELYMLNML